MILDVPLERLRARSSVKWQAYPADVLPLWVAEMDVELAPPIHDVLAAMIAGGDTGYAWAGSLAESYAGFAKRRWDLDVDPDRTYVLQDVMRGVLEIVQVGTSPGDGVVINPPVYRPFYDTIEHAGRRVVEVPLIRDTDDSTGAGVAGWDSSGVLHPRSPAPQAAPGRISTNSCGTPARDAGTSGTWRLDLDGLDAAFAAGATAWLLCSPHNPVGRVWTREELTAAAEVADRHGVLVLADEIHAPLVHAPARFVPISTVDVGAARDAISFGSASKAWNLAGLKAALVVAATDTAWGTVAAMGEEVGFGTGILGVAAAQAAFDDGEPWLDQLLGELADRRALLGRLLEQHLPQVRYRPPEATFLAWLDCRGLGLPDPQARFLEAGRVALEPGPKYGPGGDGFVRLNFATSQDVLTEAVTRMAAAARGPA